VTQAPKSPAGSGRRPKLLLIVQVVLTLVAFGYLFHIADLPALQRTFEAAPLWSIPAAIAALLSVLFAGTLRWSLLLSAYGAARLPPLLYLFRLQLIGLFYNMMPGAVGGDLLRGVVSRHAFGPQGMSAGLIVVLVERVFGLLALLLLVISVLSFHPVYGLELPAWLLALLMLASVGALAGIALARRLAPHLPAWLAQRAAALPGLSRPGMFVLALLMSVANQALVGVMGHLTIVPLAPQVSLLDSLVLSPLAFAAIFFPLTVAGAGTRDAAMIALYGYLGVSRESALSASLQILVAYIAVAAIGGTLSFFTPLTDAASDTREPAAGTN
jgi:glycosyltransferase 2 family protein